MLAAFFDAERMRALEPLVDPERDSGLDYYPLLRPGERFPIADPALEPRLSPRPDDGAGSGFVIDTDKKLLVTCRHIVADRAKIDVIFPWVRDGELVTDRDLEALSQASPGEALGYRRLEELGGPAPLRVLTVGGGARNAPWQRIRERLLGTTVLRAPSQEAAVGAARLARLAVRTA